MRTTSTFRSDKPDLKIARFGNRLATCSLTFVEPASG